MIYPWLSEIEQQLSTSLRTGRFHHAQLFNGQQGVGKTAMVEQLADALLCQQPSNIKACGQCKSCQLNQAGTHPDKFNVQVEGQSIGVDEIRTVSDFMSHSAAQNGNKVVIIKDCHKMTTAAANALLKTLEEPSPQRFLLLTTTTATQLPATILSRCSRTDVQVSDTDSTQQWLASLQIIDYPWLSLFYQQPLLVQAWQQADQLTTIEQLYKFATSLKQGHNFSELVDIINKDSELIRVFCLFVSDQLKQQLVSGMQFDAYQQAQQALTEFYQNSTQVLGLNLPLAVSRLAYSLRNG
ncbi:DNA polymerase III subunit delta' [Pseudoalteromonas shioyasakiensis]|uniref:DNA polymerase III subunit delta' n=1 Tax=Pseudoalteromonas shioyasakiensis TaxID=1190813 RepID=UPI00211747CA|nr:DNA polymerase III subunit delta' [Pseudoalteromonas shioyasakiensis]MCQ8876497.1 DNA polymerase III subunit delta' [Pseudoalteromonas shioyasakiensis]